MTEENRTRRRIAETRHEMVTLRFGLWDRLRLLLGRPVHMHFGLLVDPSVRAETVYAHARVGRSERLVFGEPPTAPAPQKPLIVK